MNDKTEQIEKPESKEKRAVEKIDFTKPFALLIYQTASRNNIVPVTGPDCLAEAEKMAAGLALQQGHTVAVFGPQCKVKIPPAEPSADDLPLDF